MGWKKSQSSRDNEQDAPEIVNLDPQGGQGKVVERQYNIYDN